MKIYIVDKVSKFEYDFSISVVKCGCFTEKKNALNKAKKVYENIRAVYSDEENFNTEELPERGYYCVSFGYDEDYESHSISVKECDLED